MSTKTKPSQKKPALPNAKHSQQRLAMPRPPDTGRMYEEMAAGMPNYVTCETCGRRETVNGAECLRLGWPTCHGQTMTLGARHSEKGQR